MIKVYIWDFLGKKTAWGHASMHVNERYISWWPESTGRVSSKIHRDIYSASPIANRSFEDDKRDEDQDPNDIIDLTGLDEKLIIDKWIAIAASYSGLNYYGPPLSWNSLEWNCAKVVATCLNAGGGDDYAQNFSRWIPVWTPANVQRYARAIKAGMSNAIDN